MKIAILEFETHSHLLYLWEELLHNQNNIQYHFFISLPINKQIEKIPASKKTIIEKVEELNNKLTDFDLVIFNTLHRNFEKYTFIFQEYKILLLVHNANFYFNTSQPNYKYLFCNLNFQLNYYYLKLIFKKKIYKTKKLIKRVGAFGFLSQEILNFNNKEKEEYKFFIPLFYTKKIFWVEDTPQIKITIPGNISQCRRNYQLIFSILPVLKPKEKLLFVFLGKPENNKMLNELMHLSKKINSTKIQIKYHTQWISQQDFDAEMFSSHYFLCPIHKETSFYLQKEIYGKTKMTGNESDCIYYGKTGIFPDYYHIKNWKNYHYKNKQELINLLENLTFEQYKEDNKALMIKAELFSKSKAEKQLQTVFNKLINI